ncbi:hypothetical protein NIES2100_35190 [Calothrix sp. NIES-2100]|uniref:hypothetical protein n=1 Tax=Calothrix sp. NIES-2100 TaxID=1954172 RepID=UPI000B61A714|nr:hypothetical protein NIES2100_35190 [Calothrix sp. NIES-2100]
MYLYKYETGQQEYYANSFIEPSRKNGYVDISDLKYCLHLFYSGGLDDVDDYLSRLYLPPRDLDPTNSLFGLLDTQTVEEALSSISEDYQSVIEVEFTQNPTASERLQHFYVQSLTPLTFAEWVDHLFTDAIYELSHQIRALI